MKNKIKYATSSMTGKQLLKIDGDKITALEDCNIYSDGNKLSVKEGENVIDEIREQLKIKYGLSDKELNSLMKTFRELGIAMGIAGAKLRDQVLVILDETPNVNDIVNELEMRLPEEKVKEKNEFIERKMGRHNRKW